MLADLPVLPLDFTLYMMWQSAQLFAHIDQSIQFDTTANWEVSKHHYLFALRGPLIQP